MKSIFTFIRGRARTPSVQLLTEPSPNAVVVPAVHRAAMAETLTTNNDSSLNQALDARLAVLEKYFPPPSVPPPPGPPLPAASLSLVSVTERSVGLGKRVGNDVRGPFSVLALKGTHIEAVVRFQLWASSSSDVDDAIRDLTKRLLGDMPFTPSMICGMPKPRRSARGWFAPAEQVRGGNRQGDVGICTGRRPGKRNRQSRNRRTLCQSNWIESWKQRTGTKFRIFPQPRFLVGITEPELIRINVPPAQMQAGPADDRMFVVDAINKQPYSDFDQPPYRGPANPPEPAF